MRIITNETEDVLLAKGYRYMRDGLPEKSGPYHTQGYFRRSRVVAEMRLFYNRKRNEWARENKSVDGLFVVVMWKGIDD